MDKLSELLKYIQKTNPSMDRKRLIEELGKKPIFKHFPCYGFAKYKAGKIKFPAIFYMQKFSYPPVYACFIYENRN